MELTFALIELMLSLLLFLLSGKINRYPSNKWRLLYLVPFFVAVLFTFFIDLSFKFAGLFIAAAVYISWFYIEDLKLRRLLSFVAVILCVATTIYLS